MASETTVEFVLKINEAERAELLRMVDHWVRETHAEKRRTEAPEFHDVVAREEQVLRGLADKVRKLRP